jgi:Fic family protein
MNAARSRIGHFVDGSLAGQRYRAYVPPPLPPVPPLALEPLYPLIDRATQAVARLDGVASLLPDLHSFIYLYVRKEAVLSSQIEGTQSSLADLLLFEVADAPGVPVNDILEVSRYVAAMEHGLDRLRGGFPLSLRLIRELHGELLSTGRGRERNPGEFRTSQNWIGGPTPARAVFVPPPPDQLLPCLDALERFLHAEYPPLPILVRAALVHVQFETIHPFLDGNGRIGRLLVTLMLVAAGTMRSPILYLSLHLKAHRDRYYDLLQRVRLAGAWEEWVEFFLAGVAATAEQAIDATRRILDLFEADRQRIAGLGRSASAALRVHAHLTRHPLATAPEVAIAIGLSRPTVQKTLDALVRIDMVRETTGRQRHRRYLYDAYLAILSEGTEPLPR